MKRIKKVAYAVLVIALFISPYIIVGALDRHDERKAQEKKAEAIQVEVISEPIIVHRVAEMPKAEVKPVSVKTVEGIQEEEHVVTYPVPLDEELQLFIIGLCEEHHIDPAVVICMIHQESSFNASMVGDSGEAFGLMQVWPKWHSDRMERLGCTDLLDPYQNVTVGIDYYAECLDKYDGDNAKALTAYNQGSYKGVVNKHAKAVLAKLENLKEVME